MGSSVSLSVHDATINMSDRKVDFTPHKRSAKIETAINAGITIIVDRYYWSGVVYTAAKQLPSLTRPWSRNCDVGLPTPDICFFLSITAEAARQRGGGYGEERYEKERFQESVRNAFDMLFLFEGWERVRKVDAGRSAEEVERELLEAAEGLFEKLARGELGEQLSKVLSNEVLETRNRVKELRAKEVDQQRGRNKSREKTREKSRDIQARLQETEKDGAPVLESGRYYSS